MFASKTPRDLNHDPTPWLWSEDGVPRGRTGGEHQFPLEDGWTNQNDPRPEFDHVQHNEPNPILVDARVAEKQGYTYWEIWSAFSGAYTYSQHYITQDWEQITDSHLLIHAYKVLSRLARLERNGEN